MKKLSIKTTDVTSRFVLPITPKGKVYREIYSGFITTDSEVKGCCCNCHEQYCIKYSQQETHSVFFNQFPHNTSRRICPTDAIYYDDNDIHIDNQKCIGCGICLHRCPFLAFAYNAETGRCFVQYNKSKSPGSLLEQETQIELSRSLPVSYNYQNISKPFIEDKALDIVTNTDAPEIIVRNFLINLGITANTHAKGNQHNRIEFFAYADERFLIGECEASNDVLSVSRRILDDLAVLVSRHSIEVKNIIPLAVINRLPNKRTDYYEVIDDIKNVIGVQINTVSYACLFFLNLFNCQISVSDFQTFLLNRNSSDLCPPITRLIPSFAKVCSFYNSGYFSVQK